MLIDAVSVLCAQPTRDLLAIVKFLFISWWVCCFVIDASGCTWATTPVLADPNVTAFLKALSLHRFCSTCIHSCTPTTCHVTRGRKFICADDICIATQGQYFSELKCSLSSDMTRMSHFRRQWRLKPSASKTISSATVFHLHESSATR